MKSFNEQYDKLMKERAVKLKESDSTIIFNQKVTYYTIFCKDKSINYNQFGKQLTQTIVLHEHRKGLENPESKRGRIY